MLSLRFLQYFPPFNFTKNLIEFHIGSIYYSTPPKKKKIQHVLLNENGIKMSEF